MRKPGTRHLHRGIIFFAGALGTILLSGCATGGAVTSGETSPVVTESSASASAAPLSEEDQAFSDFVASLDVLVSENLPSQTQVTEALEAVAQFSSVNVSVTADRTPTNLNVDSISVAYRYDEDTCFLGQFIDSQLVSEKAAPVNGVCLVGEVAQ